MTNRKICNETPLIWLTLTIVLVGMTGFVIFLAVTRDPINKENYNKIQPGMTRSEVEAILGPTSPDIISGAHVWYGSNNIILIVFDKDGFVADKDIRQTASENIIDKVRHWFRLDSM